MITHYQPVRLSRTARGKCPMTAAEARERINIATDYHEGNIHD